MSVPLFRLDRQNQDLLKELEAATSRVLRSGQFVLGPEVDDLERDMANYLGVADTLAVSSGTDALLLALMTAGIGPGDEVFVPSFTFFATAGCVARLGARPVFVDVCPICYNLDPSDLAAKITPRSKAVLPVHLFGQSAEMDGILQLAETHGLTVIEDCAQSIGARYRGRMTGTMGEYGAISFFPTKNLGGFGDAGLLLARDPDMFERARILRVHGMSPKYYHPFIGGNFRCDPLLAALLRVKLPQLDAYNQQRADNAARYHSQLGDHERIAPLSASNCRCLRGDDSTTSGDPAILLPVAYDHNHMIWNQFTIRVPGEGRRDDLRRFLAEREIGSEIYYPLPLDQQECFQAHQPDPCPTAARIASECLSLPVFPELTEAEIEEVIAAICQWLEDR